MKAIILAAGCCTRFGNYLKGKPKSLLNLCGKSLLEIQIQSYKRIGINNIIIVKGYGAEHISIPDVKYYFQNQYNSTNIVCAFMSASKEFDDDVIMSYGDLVFEDSIIEKTLNSIGDVAVAVDENWKFYWKKRYDNIETDLESLTLDSNDRIIEIGNPNVYNGDMDTRYVGVVKFTKSSLKSVLEITSKAATQFSQLPWMQSQKPYAQSHMTDLLQAMILSGVFVKGVRVKNGWIEFDNLQDYQKVLSWINDGSINELFSNFYTVVSF